MRSCITCGMPFEGNHQNDIGLETNDGPVCTFDSIDGAIKPAAAIFDGGVEFFLTVSEGNRELAERLTRKNMKTLPYWQQHPFEKLEGPEATEEEFATAMQQV